MAAGHAGDFAGGVQAGDRLEIFVEDAAAQIGFGAAEIFPRERKELNCVVRRRVKLLGQLQRFAELGLDLKAVIECFIVALDRGKKRPQVHFDFSR
jgi:hypothetical protein